MDDVFPQDNIEPLFEGGVQGLLGVGIGENFYIQGGRDIGLFITLVHKIYNNVFY